MNAKFYKVGGYVRDKLLGVKSHDIDYACECESYDAMREAIIARGCSIKLEKPEYLTIRAVEPKVGGVDFVLCRKDGAYTDGRRPESVEAGTILDDLARRDFTMNAMALSDEGNLIDPFGGKRDLELRLLRCVGDAEIRMREDKLRLLRAIRFSIVKGFTIGFDIEEILMDKRFTFDGVSADRIRDELFKCFEHDTPQTLRSINYWPALKGIFEKHPIKLTPVVIH